MENTKNYLNVTPRADLYSEVILRINTEKMRSAKKRLYYTFLAISSSTVALVFAFINMLSSLSHSGFYSYISLVFSDGSALASSWKEFAFSLLESFSLPEFIILLSVSLVVLISVKAMIKNLKVIHAPVQFI